MKPFFQTFIFFALLCGAVRAEEADNRKVSVDEIARIECNSFQPGSEIQNVLDGNPDTHWHSGWNESEAYPYRIDVKFEKMVKIDRICYLPRQDGGNNGNIEEYNLWVKARAKSEWKLLQHGKLAATKSSKFITFPVQECVGVRLEVLKGVSGFGSAAEITFFYCDEELLPMDSIFSDRSFSALRTDAKGKIPADLKQKLAQMRRTAKRPEILAEIAIAETLLKPKTAKSMKRRVFTARQQPSADLECRWRRGGFPWSNYQPTGFEVDAEEHFEVYVEAKPGDPLPNLVIHDLRTSDWGDQTSIPLTVGRNYLEAPRAGILFIENPCEPGEQSQAPVLHFEHVREIPFYELGKTTAKEWQERLAAPNPYGMVEFSSPHVLITASMKNVAKHLDNPEALLKTYEYIMGVYAHFLGFSEKETLPPNCRPKCVMHLIEVDHSYMYATSYRTAYHFDAMQSVLNAVSLQKDGWGPWHEIGHMHQVQQYKFQGLSEVTVNLFSLEMQTSMGSRARIDEEGMRDQIAAHFQASDRDFHAIEDVFMKLAMFWQLRLAFGDDFYPSLHRFYRENELDLPDDDAKVQAFIRVTSQISGWNLAPFYDAWGLPIDPQTRIDIQKWKPLTKPIWLNLEFSKVPPKGVLGMAKQKKTGK